MKIEVHTILSDARVTRRQLPGRCQQGAVLIVSLLLLLIMTLIGVTTMSTTSLEEKMAGNMRDKNTALQAAEAALEDGESWIAPLGLQPAETTTCGAPPCDMWALNVLPDLSSQSQSWWLSNGREYGAVGSKDISDVNTDPHYILEAQSFVPDSLDMGQNPPTGKSIYRVTAHGTGGSDDAQVILQTTFVKRFN